MNQKNLQKLQTQAVLLYQYIEKKTRNLQADRLKLGKLLVRIRQQFIDAQPTGTKLRRGRKGNAFCAWLEDSGMNIGTAYNYIRLADKGSWGPATQPSRKRIVFWQKFSARMKVAATLLEKKKLLRQAIDYLLTTYDIDAKVRIA